MSASPEVRWHAPPAIRGIRAAFIFFTRLPVGGFPYRPADWHWAAAHAPLIGLVLGAALGVLDRALAPLGAAPAALFVIAASLLLTGAFHEDGLADTSDALGGGYAPERVLAILKDSRIGTFGGAALVVSIAGRTALLAQLGTAAYWALPLSWCAARVGPIWIMATLPYVTQKDAAKSRDLTQGGVAQALVATLWFGVAALAFVHFGACGAPRIGALSAAIASVTALCAWRFWARLRGITGDFLGATEQLCELVALATLAWRF